MYTALPQIPVQLASNYIDTDQQMINSFENASCSKIISLFNMLLPVKQQENLNYLGSVTFTLNINTYSRLSFYWQSKGWISACS
jgi:hypothetical protein